MHVRKEPGNLVKAGHCGVRQHSHPSCIFYVFQAHLPLTRILLTTEACAIITCQSETGKVIWRSAALDSLQVMSTQGLDRGRLLPCMPLSLQDTAAGTSHPPAGLCTSIRSHCCTAWLTWYPGNILWELIPAAGHACCQMLRMPVAICLGLDSLNLLSYKLGSFQSPTFSRMLLCFSDDARQNQALHVNVTALAYAL